MPTTATATGPRAVHGVRAAWNLLNGSTVLGVLIALAGRARLRRGPELLLIGEHYRLPLPRAGAFTVGNVVMVPNAVLDSAEAACPGTTGHEARHSSQYAWFLGLPFLPCYAVASGWSWLRTGDPWSRNWFERDAGLARGGYPEGAADNAGLRRAGTWMRGLVGRARATP